MAAESERKVGPVLAGGPTARGVAAAIVRANPGAKVDDRGGYIRISASGRCVVTRASIESELGHEFVLPRDLERVMTSFRGKLFIDEDQARWE